jgi:hypothetical protein
MKRLLTVLLLTTVTQAWAESQKGFDAEVYVESQRRWVKVTKCASTSYDARGLLEAEYGQKGYRNVRQASTRDSDRCSS